MGKTVFCLGAFGCALWLVGCGKGTASFRPEEESLYESEWESTAENLYGTAGEASLQPEDTDPYEHTIYELLDRESLEEYLQSYGVEAVNPVCFCDPDGEPRLELYFDWESGQGCGLKYEETEAGTELLGFALPGYDQSARASYWDYTNPYSIKTRYDDGAVQVAGIPYFLRRFFPIEKFEESCSYDEDGRLCAYRLDGDVQTEDGGVKEELLSVSFSYRKEGSLQEKVYRYNGEYFRHFAVGEERYDVYDGKERLLYADLAYDGEFYFIYDGEAMIPTAYLELNSRWLDFVRLEDKDYDNRVEVPRDGVETFLNQVGLTSEDKFYEYQWHNESSSEVVWSWSDIVLTLYYDPERELGCGYQDSGEAFEDMLGFVFQGCVEIDGRENDPYGVFALYNTCEHYRTDEIEIRYLSPEELSEAYLYESQYVCEYDGERLMRIYMSGSGSGTERFFLYDGDSDMPSYCLNLGFGTFAGVTLFKFVY